MANCLIQLCPKAVGVGRMSPNQWFIILTGAPCERWKFERLGLGLELVQVEGVQEREGILFLFLAACERQIERLGFGPELVWVERVKES